MEYIRYGYRLRRVSIHTEAPYSWVFLPGGPGLGSEYLRELCVQLELPGTSYLVDFPQDGTNYQGVLDLNAWQSGLVELCRSLPSPIIVAHSFAGMLALYTPALESILAGLVLINTAPHRDREDHLRTIVKNRQLPDVTQAFMNYLQNPSDGSAKTLLHHYKPYNFTPDEMQKGEQLYELFAYNHRAYNHMLEHFYPLYQSKWSPKVLPTLTINSTMDYLCPSDIFSSNTDYQHPHVISIEIKGAGHYSWLNHFDKFNDGFKTFIKLLP